MTNLSIPPKDSIRSGTEPTSQVLHQTILANKDLYIQNLLKTLSAYKTEVKRLKFKHSLLENDFTSTKQQLKKYKKKSKEHRKYTKQISKLTKQNKKLQKQNDKLKDLSDTTACYSDNQTLSPSDESYNLPSDSRPPTPPDHPITIHMQQMADKLNSLKSQYLNFESNWI